MAWRDERVKVRILENHAQFCLVEVSYANDCSWLLTLVYANPNEDFKKLLWERLVVLARTISSPWVVLGDFNDIRWPSEKKRWSCC